MRGLLVIVACAVALLGCGVRAPPRPPRQEPAPAADAGLSPDSGSTAPELEIDGGAASGAVEE